MFSSYYLYTYDKMVAPNVSLRREEEVSPDVLGALLKHHYSRRGLAAQEPAMGQYTNTHAHTRTHTACRNTQIDMHTHTRTHTHTHAHRRQTHTDRHAHTHTHTN